MPKNCLLLYLLLLSCFAGAAQEPLSFQVQEIPLSPELAEAENQFSGMYIAGADLYLLPENRLHDTAEARLYRASLAGLDQCIRHKTTAAPFTACPVKYLGVLARRISREGCTYEGLEAMCITGKTIYFTVETTTTSAFGYLLRGELQQGVIYMDTVHVLPLAKPRCPDGAYIYNAGFESLQFIAGKLYAFFEYNYFDDRNLALAADTSLLYAPESVPLCKIPFRLTDMTTDEAGRHTAINYFYKGKMDSAYRAPDAPYGQLIRDSSGYHGYCRLLRLEDRQGIICGDTAWTFPDEWRSYNWEGIAAYKGGYWLINDKYTAAAPYRSVLLYLSPGH